MTQNVSTSPKTSLAGWFMQLTHMTFTPALAAIRTANFKQRDGSSVYS